MSFLTTDELNGVLVFLMKSPSNRTAESDVMIETLPMPNPSWPNGTYRPEAIRRVLGQRKTNPKHYREFSDEQTADDAGFNLLPDVRYEVQPDWMRYAQIRVRPR